MEIRDGLYNEYDYEAAKILDDFLPDKLFDAHMHLHDRAFNWESCEDGCFAMRPRGEVCHYFEDMHPLIGNRDVTLNILINPEASMKEPQSPDRIASTEFLVEMLNKYPGHVGEVVVGPHDTVEDIEKELVHPGIRGFKCYHSLADRKPTWQAGIGEYLPESAWEVADKRGLAITLHMVRDKALADPVNLNYIKTMAKKYPNAVLILAHAARSFAAWTGLETVDEVKMLDNVWFDFGAVCESPAMFQIMRKAGVEKCMWGSDYPVGRMAGKAISLGDSFYWIYEKDLKAFSGATSFHSYLIATENFMATRQACLMLDLNQDRVEDLFYRNAKRLFGV